MPFRERARALFKTKSRSDSTTNSSSTTTNSSSSTTNRDRYPSNVYRPDEPMPRPKYRMPPKKEHKEKLEAFNFADAWRKRSFQSSYSPMGTRAPSRRNSFHSLLARKSRPGSRAGSRAGSRNNSIGEADVGFGGGAGVGGGVGSARPRESGGAALLHPNAAGVATMETQPEQDGDDDVANVGLSRVQSRNKTAPRSTTNAAQRRPNINGVVPPGVTAHDHQPFSEQELQLAMQRSHLTVAAQS